MLRSFAHTSTLAALLGAALFASGCEEDPAKAVPVATPPYSATGIPDAGFGTSGLATYNNTPGAGSDVGQAMAIQPDGKIVVTGLTFNGANDDMLLARFNTNGTLDTAFGGTGVVTYNHADNGNDAGHAVAIQPDGKIVVAGEIGRTGPHQDMAVWRYNADGTPDTTFNTSGFLSRGGDAGGVTLNDMAWGVAMDGVGRIVVAGQSANALNADAILWRFSTTGVLDTAAFAGGTGFAAYVGAGADIAFAVAVQPDGKIVTAGFSFVGGIQRMAVWRYTAAGTLDTATFNTAGPTQGLYSAPILAGGTADTGNALTIDGAGNLVVSGVSNNGANDTAAIWRVLPSGAPDLAFGGTGAASIGGAGVHRAWSHAMDVQGRILVAGEGPGTGPDLYLWRLLPDGTLDPAFALGLGFLVIDSATASTNNDIGRAIRFDGIGRIVVAGVTDVDHLPAGAGAEDNADLALWRFQ